MTRSEVYNNVDNRNQQNSSFERAQHDGKVQSFIYDSKITGILIKMHHNHIFNVDQHTVPNLDIQRNSTLHEQLTQSKLLRSKTKCFKIFSKCFKIFIPSQ